MEPAVTPPDPEGRWALFLDVDGTLVEIAPAPDAVVVPPRLVALLRTLEQALAGAVALVSGRSVASLDRLFAPLNLACAGNHGLERRRTDGVLIQPPVPRDALERARRAFAVFAAGHQGALVEDKSLSVALHYRGAPALAEGAERLAETLEDELAGALRIQRGKMMVELRPAGGDKGSVVRDFMAEPPFAGRVPVFIGDDVTDEDGFRAVNALGGVSVRVGDSAAPTEAGFRMESTEAVYGWLSRLAAAPARETAG
jgi:trehalose 6-phosphate phosphatase